MIVKSDPGQGNLLDGTVVAYQPLPQSGAYVTVAGRDGAPTIIAFDLADLTAIRQAEEAARTAPADGDPDELARNHQGGHGVTTRGARFG